MSYFEFPHTRTYDSDLGWIIEHLKTNIDNIAILQTWAASHKSEYDTLKEKVDALIDGLVDVISPWDSSVPYNIFDIVEYQGTNYIAVQAVPVGTMITNTEYWQPANTVIEQVNAIGLKVQEIYDHTCIQIMDGFDEFESDRCYFIEDGEVFNSTLVVPAVSNIKIRIKGTITTTVSGLPIIHLSACDNVEIEGGVIDCANLATSGVRLADSTNCNIHDVTIINAGNDDATVAMGIAALGQCDGLIVKNVHIKDITAGTAGSDNYAHAAGVGIMSREVEGVTKHTNGAIIDACIIENINNTKAGSSFYDGDAVYIIQRPYELNDETVYPQSNIVVSNCIVKNSLKRAVKISGENVTVIGLKTYGTFYNSCIDVQTKNAIIDSCDLNNGSDYNVIGIAADAQISNCHINNGNYALYVYEALYYDTIDSVMINNIAIDSCASILYVGRRTTAAEFNYIELNNIRCNTVRGTYAIHSGANVTIKKLSAVGVDVETAENMTTPVYFPIIPTELMRLKNSNMYPFAPNRGQRSAGITDIETTPQTATQVKTIYMGTKRVQFSNNVAPANIGQQAFSSQVGDICINTDFTSSIFGWYCTIAGSTTSAGTWVAINRS